MKYIVSPMESVSPLDSCSCTGNTGDITYNECTKCGGNCSTLEVCVTPTGVKLSPTGINEKS